MVIVLFDTLANTDSCEEIEDFTRNNEEYLRRYIGLKNGIPSYDMI